MSRKRVQRIMRTMGLAAIYRRPRTSRQPTPGNKVHPYLLRGREINRPNRVWAADITYIPICMDRRHGGRVFGDMVDTF